METLAHAPEITNLSAELERAAALFQTVTAPEVATIDDDLRTIKIAADDLIATFTDLANECAHQKTAHDNMKGQLSDALSWFATELGIEVAVTAALAVAASLVSFGVGGAAVTAVRAGKFAHLVTKIVDRLRGIVVAAGLRSIVTLSRNTVDTRTKLERLHDAIETAEDTVEATATPKPWDPNHRPPGVPGDWVARTADNGKGVVWQKPGSVQNADSVRVMEPTARYPNGYVRFYNSGGHPVNLDGKPGPNSETHIAINPDGTYPLPKGW